MKKTTKKIVALALAVLIAVSALCGCSSNGKTLMTLGDKTISVNFYELLLSRFKGTMAYYGFDVSDDDFWDTIIDLEDQSTYCDYFTESVLDNAKSYLCILYLFDELKLELPESYINDVDSELADMVESIGQGSKTKFNSIVGEYGVNYNILREAYILEAKYSYLQESLYGKDGAKIADNVKEEYYKENYYRFKHIFLYTYKAIYETDENGDYIYFNSDGTISYNKEKGALKYDENGQAIKDSKGNAIYYTEDGKIAYDKIAGERAYVYDENGYPKIEAYTDAEVEAVRQMSETIMSRLDNGEDFEKLMSSYNEDLGGDKYTNGYYITADAQFDYDSEEIVRAVTQEMSVGEYRKFETTFENNGKVYPCGIHIVMKYELDDGAYKNSVNEDFFANFNSTLSDQLLMKRIEPYKSDIVVDDELASTVDLKKVSVNYNY